MMIRKHILKKRLMIPSHTKGGEQAPLARPTLSPEIHTRDTRTCITCRGRGRNREAAWQIPRVALTDPRQCAHECVESPAHTHTYTHQTYFRGPFQPGSSSSGCFLAAARRCLMLASSRGDRASAGRRPRTDVTMAQLLSTVCTRLCSVSRAPGSERTTATLGPELHAPKQPDGCTMQFTSRASSSISRSTASDPEARQLRAWQTKIPESAPAARSRCRRSRLSEAMLTRPESIPPAPSEGSIGTFEVSLGASHRHSD